MTWDCSLKWLEIIFTDRKVGPRRKELSSSLNESPYRVCSPVQIPPNNENILWLSLLICLSPHFTIKPKFCSVLTVNILSSLQTLIILGTPNIFCHKEWKADRRALCQTATIPATRFWGSVANKRSDVGLGFNQKAACLSASWTQQRHAIQHTDHVSGVRFHWVPCSRWHQPETRKMKQIVSRWVIELKSQKG